MAPPRAPFARPEPANPAPAAPRAAAPTAAAPTAEKPAEAAAPDASKAALAKQRDQAIARGVAYLITQQAENGAWGDGNVGITTLCADALLETGKTIKDEPVRKAVDFIVKYQQDDGGIYDQGLRTYTTSLALMVLARADPKTHAAAIEKAKAYLIEHQWDEPESIDQGNPWYGGHGGGGRQRAEPSKTR